MPWDVNVGFVRGGVCVCLCESMCVCDMCVSLVLSNINILRKYLIITKIQLFNQVWLMWWFGLVVWGVWEIEVLLVFFRSKNVDVYHGLFCFPPSQPPSVQKGGQWVLDVYRPCAEFDCDSYRGFLGNFQA